MAGTVTITEQPESRNISRIKWAWTSTAGGAADGTTAGTFNGLVYACVTDPSATAPTADYDITIVDDDGLDVLQGNGADRSATATEYLSYFSDGLGIVHDSVLTLNVANAGDAKLGIVWLDIVQPDAA